MSCCDNDPNGVLCGEPLGAKRDSERLTAATETLAQLKATISQDFAKKAVCAIVVPGMKKGGFIVGAKYGRGFASCRDHKGGWTDGRGGHLLVRDF